MNTTIHRGRVALWMLFLLGIGLSATLLVLMTGTLNGLVRSGLERALNSEGGATFRIGEISGNPLSTFSIGRMSVVSRDGNHLEFGDLHIRYQPIYLLLGQVRIDTLQVVSPQARFVGDAGGSTGLDSAELGPGDWSLLSFRISNLVVDDGVVVFGAGQQGIRDLNLEAALHLDHDGSELVLNRFRSVVLDPPLTIRNARASARFGTDELYVEYLDLLTSGSKGRISGTVRGFDAPFIDMRAKIDSLSLMELGGFLDIPLTNQVAWLEGRVTGPLSNLSVQVDYVYGSAAGAVVGRVDATSRPVSYDLALQARDLDVAHVIPTLGLDYIGDLDATIVGSGDRLDRVVLRGARGRLYSAPVDSVSAEISIGGEGVNGAFRFGGGTGTVRGTILSQDDASGVQVACEIASLDLSALGGPETDLHGQLDVDLGDGPVRLSVQFDTVRVQDMPLGVLTGKARVIEDTLHVDALSLTRNDGEFLGKGYYLLTETGPDQIRHHLDVQGRYLPRFAFGDPYLPDTLFVSAGVDGYTGEGGATRSRIDVTVRARELFGSSLDSARFDLALSGSEVTLDRGLVVAEGNRVSVNGSAILGSSLALDVDIRIPEAGWLPHLEEAGISGWNLGISGGVSGAWLEPHVGLEITADSVVVAGAPVRGITVRTDWSSGEGGGARLTADSATWGGRTLRGVYADITDQDDSYSFLVGTNAADTDRFFSWGMARDLGDRVAVRVDSILVNVDQVSLTNRGPTLFGYSSTGRLYLERLHIVGPTGSVVALEDPDFRQTLVVSITEVDLRPVVFLFGSIEELEGTLSGEMVLSGSLDDPLISAELELRGARVGPIAFDTLAGTASMGQGQGYLDFSMSGPEFAGRIHGNIPLRTQPVWGIADNRPGHLGVLVQDLDLALLAVLTDEVQAPGGRLSADLQFQGTRQDLTVDGSVRVSGGQFTLPSLAQRFDRLEARATLRDSIIRIDTLTVAGGTGTLSFEGQIRHGPVVMLADDPAGVVTGMDIEIRGNDFGMLNLPDLRASVTPSVRLTGIPSHPALTGQVVLNSAEIRLLSLIEAPEDPKSVWIDVPFFANLACDLDVSATKQVWVRDQNVNVELAGDITMEREAGIIRLYGSLGSLRGTYEFRGRSFRIAEGQIEFQGQPDINPQVFIVGQTRMPYVSHDGQQDPGLIQITVTVGGTLVTPEISLNSDPALDESDLLSYLVFGGPTAGLLQGEQDAIAGQSSGLVLGLAASQLQERVGRKLNLDLMQVEMGGTRVSRVRVGKYIGTRTFVTYDEAIGTDEREVTIEYELLPSLKLESQLRIDKDGDEQGKLRVVWQKDW